ncbi:Uncharacterized protein K02A2.6, partial [Toxocara canis]
TLDGSKSPAELFIGRKLRTTPPVLSPKVHHKPIKNTRMERQFNRQYGARNRTFKRGDSVLVRNYQGQRVSWTKGKVLKWIGRKLYQILVGEDTRIRHANQLRKGFADPNYDQSDD